MGYLNPGPDDEYRIASQAQNGTTDVPGAGTLEGALTAIPKGIGSAAEKIGDVMSLIGGAIDPIGTDQARLADNGTTGIYGERLPGQWGPDAPTVSTTPPAWNFYPSQASIKDALPAARVVSDWSATGQDPRETGSFGRILNSLSENFTIGAAGSIAGPWGAAGLLGSSQGYSDYLQNKWDGMDDATAMEKAGLTAGFSAASAFVPLKMGNGITSGVALPALANVVTGAAQRASTSAVLDANGYPEMAKQYRVFDGETMASDVLLGAAFGVYGHFLHAGGRPEVGAIKPADVDAALAQQSEEHFNRSSPGIPTSPDVANAHVDTMRAAVDALARGDEPNVSSEVAQKLVDGTVPDPNHDTLGMLNEAARSELPGYDDAIKPIDAIEPTVREPLTTPEPAVAGDGAANDESFGHAAAPEQVPMDPMMRYRIDAIRQNPVAMDMLMPHPDGSGRTITVSDMLDMMEQEHAEMDRMAGAHEVAAACFISTGM